MSFLMSFSFVPLIADNHFLDSLYVIHKCMFLILLNAEELKSQDHEL